MKLKCILRKAPKWPITQLDAASLVGCQPSLLGLVHYKLTLDVTFALQSLTTYELTVTVRREEDENEVVIGVFGDNPLCALYH